MIFFRVLSARRHPICVDNAILATIFLYNLLPCYQPKPKIDGVCSTPAIAQTRVVHGPFSPGSLFPGRLVSLVGNDQCGTAFSIACFSRCRSAAAVTIEHGLPIPPVGKVEPAVDPQELPGRESGRRGGQVENGVGDVFRGSVPPEGLRPCAEGRVGFHRRVLLSGHRVEGTGVDDPRQHPVDADVVAPILEGEGLHHRVFGRHGKIVGRRVRPRHGCRYGTHDHDRTTVVVRGFRQIGKGGLGQKHRGQNGYLLHR
mmetsp:Transcript_10058/g.21159  ORF Transcript_10058/g.21159 Transcript_10058/m.21159 type:complete len:257 (-) Transcript_10058:520-1290(-)